MSTMATKTVRDIMNAKLLYISQGERPSLARRHILKFGVTAVPVLDETHRPVGVVSLRDLQRTDDEVQPPSVVATVKETDSIEEGAKKLAATDFHHLVVVDAKGVAVGLLSSFDFLRALLGLQPRHPTAFDEV